MRFGIWSLALLTILMSSVGCMTDAQKQIGANDPGRIDWMQEAFQPMRSESVQGIQ
jgi:hypothetical protein